jgi:hypothetical protein
VWYTRHLDQASLPGEFENVIVLSEAFWKELEAHPIPVDLGVVRGLADGPGALDFYLWVCWRCWTAKQPTNIPLFGPAGLVQQLGVKGYATHRKFRQTIKRWLVLTKELWPGSPADISADGNHLTLGYGRAIR